MSGEHDYLFKMLIIGDTAVGKSALLLRFCDKLFNSTYVTTIGVDFKIRTIQIPYPTPEQLSNVKLQIWDTAGQEKFRTICQTYYRGTHGIMVVYDVTNRESFQSIEQWLKECDIHAGKEANKLLVGTKIDKEGRVVSFEEGQNLADKLGVKFVETSSLSGDNVEKAFTELATQILQTQGANLRKRDPVPIIKPDSVPKSKGCC